MNAKNFVEGVRLHVMEAAVADTVSVVVSPPGRQPDSQLVELSTWYQSLGQEDKAMLERFAAMVAHAATFGMFAVLDMSRKIDPASDGDDYFELRHVRADAIDIICGPNGEVLHEIL